MARHSRALLSVLLVAVACAACKPRTPPQTPPPPSPQNPAPPPSPPAPPAPPPGDITVNGTERLGWFQEVPDNVPASAFRFTMAVDGTRVALTDASCTSVAEGRYLACAAPLPPMSAGRHTLALIVSRTDGSKTMESAPSAPLVVTRVNSQQPVRGSLPEQQGSSPAPPVTPASTPAVEVVSDTLTAVSDLAAAPDGRVFVAERSGRVSIAGPDESTGDRTALVLDDVAVSDGLGLFSVVVHPEFAKNRYVYLAYAADTRDGRMYRLVRGREVAGRIGELASIRDLSLDGVRAWAVTRFGDDGKLYLAIGEAGTERSAILRLNADGSVPDDNAGASPMVATADGMPLGMVWSQESLLLVHEGLSGRRQLSLVGRPRSLADRQRPRASWGTDSRIAGVAQPDPSGDHVIIARLDGGIQMVQIAVSTGKLEAAAGARRAREYGAARAVAVSPDGTVYVGTANGDSREGLGPRSDYLLRLPRAAWTSR